MCDGIGDELQGINLGDQRLNRRSKHVIEALGANPEASINAACPGWGDTQAAYRFFNNGAVSPEQILAPHRAATQRRMAEYPVVLIVQDTTELDYSDHPAQDAGCLNTAERRGLSLHTHLAVTPDKLCLGVVGSEFYARSAESLGKTDQRRKLPLAEKESRRWLTGYQLACEVAGQCPQTQTVSVADSEADMYDIFVQHREAAPGTATDLIIRATRERRTLERDLEQGPYTYRKVAEEVRSSALRLTRTLELSETPHRQARQALLEIRALTVTVKPPAHRPLLGNVTYNVVLVEEVAGPGDGTDVSWLLITTLPIETAEDLLRVIDYYVARWAVEIYFRTLKTGCRVEEIQLETTQRLQNCLAFYQIIAWRVLYVTYLNRTCPNLPCTAVFADSEWKSVWRVVTKKPLPTQVPPLQEIMPLISQLGGYNNRPHEPPPGPQPIWVGLRRMLDFATAWIAFGPQR
jgi:hypothetical protein